MDRYSKTTQYKIVLFFVSILLNIPPDMIKIIIYGKNSCGIYSDLGEKSYVSLITDDMMVDIVYNNEEESFKDESTINTKIY